MRIIISDSCCLFDLQKASLLEAFVRLPYEVSVPDVIFDNELLSISSAEKEFLISIGLQILELPGDGILSVQNLRREKPALSVNDCFACILAERNTGCVLLTSDGALRKASEERGIEAHGILWCIDQIHASQTAAAQDLHNALVMFEADATVRLPDKLLTTYIEKYAGFL